MTTEKKRGYDSKKRREQSQETRRRIMASAKMLIEAKGFEKVTIDEIAHEAQVSSPCVYSLDFATFSCLAQAA